MAAFFSCSSTLPLRLEPEQLHQSGAASEQIPPVSPTSHPPAVIPVKLISPDLVSTKHNNSRNY